MPEFRCEDCGKRLFHENETTLEVEKTIHSKFCRKTRGETHSYDYCLDKSMDLYEKIAKTRQNTI